MVFEINLLPEKYRKRRVSIRIRLNARMLIPLGVVAIIALLGLSSTSLGGRLSELRSQVHALEIQRDTLLPREQLAETHRAEIASLNQRVNQLQGLGNRNTIQLMILEIVRTQLPNDLWLVDFNQTPPRQARSGITVDRGQILNFRGRAMRKERVTEFITRLQEQDLIERVSTNYLRPVQVEGADIFEFELTAILTTPGR